jgi:hypothetical protein
VRESIDRRFPEVGTLAFFNGVDTERFSPERRSGWSQERAHQRHWLRRALRGPAWDCPGPRSAARSPWHAEMSTAWSEHFGGLPGHLRSESGSAPRAAPRLLSASTAGRFVTRSSKLSRQGKCGSRQALRRIPRRRWNTPAAGRRRRRAPVLVEPGIELDRPRPSAAVLLTPFDNLLWETRFGVARRFGSSSVFPMSAQPRFSTAAKRFGRPLRYILKLGNADQPQILRVVSDVALSLVT